MENSAKHNTGTSRKQAVSQKRKFFRNIHIIIQILIFIALIAVTALLLQPLRLSVLREMTETRDYLIGEAEAFLGRNIEYASMGPSIFATLDMRDIRVLHDDGSAVLTIGRLRISYSLFALLKGDVENSLKSIRIDMPVLDIDLKRDADLIALFSASQSDANTADAERSWQGIDFLPDEIDVRLRSGSGIVRFGNNNVKVEGLSFDGDIQNRRILFRSRWRAETVLSGIFNQDIDASMSGEISGDFAADLSNGNVNLVVPELQSNLFSFKSLTMNLAVSPELIELRKIKDRSPYDLFVRYEIDTDTLFTEFFADNFSLRDVLSFNGAWNSYNEWLSLQTSGYASFLRTGADTFQYEIDLSGFTSSQAVLDNASFEIKSKGDSLHVEFFPVRLDIPQGSLFFEGSLRFQKDRNLPAEVNGNLSIKDFSLTGENPLHADFVINTYNNEINMFSENVYFGSFNLSAFDLYVINNDDELSFSVSALRFRDIESYDNVSLSRINLDGSYEFDPRHLQASLFLDSFSASDILEAAKPFVDASTLPDAVTQQMNNMLVTTELFITTDFEYITYNAPRFVASYNGINDVLAVFSVSGNGRRVTLNSGSILTGERTLGFSGDADFSDIDDISFSVQAVYNDYSYFVNGLLLDQRSLNINGSYGFSAYLIASDEGSYSGSIFADSIPIPMESGVALFSLSTFIRWIDINAWSVDLERLEIAALPMPGNTQGYISIQGIADNNGASFPNLYFDDGKGALTGTAVGNWTEAFSTANAIMVLSSQSGTEQYSAEAHYADRQFDVSMYVTGMQLSRFMENAGNIIASADADIHWAASDSFSLEMNLVSLTGMINTEPLSAYAHIYADEDSALIRDSRLDFGGFTINLSSLGIDILQSHVQASLNVKGMMAERDVDAGIDASVRFNPIESWFQIPLALQSFEGTVDVPQFLVDAESPFESFQFIVSRDETMFALNGGPNNMIRFSMSPEGDFYAGLANPLPVRGSIIGNISDGQIDAHTSNMYVDMQSLFKIIPDFVKNTIDVPTGFVDASIAVKGPLDEPEFFGTALGTSIRISLPQFLTEDIGPTPLLVTLEGTEMSFGPITTRVGDGRAEVSGHFIFNGWVPDTFTIDIFVDNEHPIPYGFAADILRVRGNASGKLLVNMEGVEFTIQGDLTAHDTILTMAETGGGINSASSTDQNLSYALIDLNISAGPRVEFIFPYESLPVVNAYASLGSRINVLADTRTGDFSLTGNVGIRGGDIFYVNRSFYIREGEVEFDETQSDFDPLITARANITEISHDGPVTISLVLDRAPVLSFTPRFESNPPLSQIDIMTLLGQGSPSDSSDPLTALSLITDTIQQATLRQRLQRSIRDLLRLDMFSARTQILQNALFLMTGLDEPSTSSFNIGNYFDNTSVYIGKYMTEDMFLQGMISYQYDDMVDTIAGTGWEIDIGLELNSPLADIRVNFVPLHLETMFVNDISLTLGWKWTF